jgi:hypothetical protein
MLSLDHLKLVQRDPTEVKKFRKHLLEAVPGCFQESQVWHEADNSCCLLESWPETVKAIADALGKKTLSVDIDARGIITD